MSPTSRSLQYLKKEGYTAQVVEKFNMFAHVRIDLFQFIDIVAMKPGEPLLAIQVTDTGDLSKRINKAESGPFLTMWLSTGCKVEFHGWSKKGKAGKRKLWTLTKKPYTIGVS